MLSAGRVINFPMIAVKPKISITKCKRKRFFL
jgi:hypothetical protein